MTLKKSKEPSKRTWQSTLLSFLDGVEGRKRCDEVKIKQARDTPEKELSIMPGVTKEERTEKLKPTLETCNIFGKPLVRVERTENKKTGRSNISS